MERWDVRPGASIGPLRLGMTRAGVRAEMGEDGERGRDDDELWFRGAIRADFDAADRVEFIEASSDGSLRLGGVDPFALDRDDVRAHLEETLGEPGKVVEQGETVRFEDHGLVLWGYAQHTDTEREFETVAVYEPGYFDR